MESNRFLIDYLPPYLAEYQEMKLIMETEQPEVGQLWNEHSQSLDNMFLQTADEPSVSRYESMLGISLNPTLSLNERRFQLQLKFNEQLPYTLRALNQKLETVCGPGEFDIELVSSEYKLTVKVGLTSKQNLQSVKEMVERMVPCNLIWTVTLKYNQHETLAQYTHEHLGQYTHNQLRNEVLT